MLVSPLTVEFKAAISTPSTVPVTVMFPVTSIPPALTSKYLVPPTLNLNLVFSNNSNTAVPFLISKSFTSKSAPNCGEVSLTKSVSIPVKFAPLTAGKVEGNLASGIVPDVRLLAL